MDGGRSWAISVRNGTTGNVVRGRFASRFQRWDSSRNRKMFPAAGQRLPGGNFHEAADAGERKIRKFSGPRCEQSVEAGGLDGKKDFIILAVADGLRPMCSQDVSGRAAASIWNPQPEAAARRGRSLASPSERSIMAVGL